MLKFGNKEFRNLQEQVAANMKTIDNIITGTNVLAEFGIKVVGQVEESSQLPDPETYEGEYGDAYIVGTEEPYEYYIFTRPFEDNDTATWFDLGIFPQPGPQGEQGPRGPQGPQGQKGDDGEAGVSAGFGTPTATMEELSPGATPTVSVSSSGPNTEKVFAFTFGLPQGSGYWGYIEGDLDDQTDLKNALDAKQDVIDASHKLPASNVSGLSTVATSGSYNDLLNKPNLATVATSGSYTDLSNKPTIGDGALAIYRNNSFLQSFSANETTELKTVNIEVPTDTSELTNGAGYITKNVNDLVNYTATSALPEVTFSTLSYTTDYVLRGISVDGVDYNVNSNVEANPADTATENLTKMKIGSTTYNMAASSIAWNNITGKPTFATVATTGSYNDLTDKPVIPVVSYPVTDVEVDGASVLDGTVAKIDLSGYVEAADLAAVATTGAYSDLSGTPTIPTATSDLTNDSGFITKGVDDLTNYTLTSGLATVALSGSYADLSNKPTIPTKTSDLTNDSGFITKSVNDLTNYTLTSALATVATSGSYNDLSNKPTINSVSANPVTTTATLTGIKIDGVSYAVASGTPANMVTTDTDQTITGVKTFDGGSGSGAKIPLKIQYDSDATESIDIYDLDAGCHTKIDTTATSDIRISLPNSDGTLALVSQIPTSISWNNISGKPTFATVATSGSYNDLLNRPTLATVATSGSYDDLTNKPTIPTVDYPVTDVTVGGVSVLSNKIAAIPALFDGNYNSLTNKPDLSVYALSSSLSTVATSGSYNDLSNKPTIPTATSDLTNDSGFITGITSAMVTTALGYTPGTSNFSGDYDDLTDKPTILGTSTETWTFTLSDNTTVTKTIVLG